MACVAVARLDDAAELRAAGATVVVTSLDEVRLEELDAYGSPPLHPER
jgi:hypothetical protein